MDREVALMVALTAARVRVEFGDLIPVLKEHADAETHRTFVIALARVMTEINSELIDRVFDMFPDIKSEFESRHNKYGRTYY
jgi:hypothetical protein